MMEARGGNSKPSSGLLYYGGGELYIYNQNTQTAVRVHTHTHAKYTPPDITILHTHRIQKTAAHNRGVP